MVGFELWELESGNGIASFATQDDALTAVAEMVHLYGESSLDTYLLTYETGTHAKKIAQGRALAALATRRADDGPGCGGNDAL